MLPMFRVAPRPATRLSAFTLIEVLLVLSLLVVISAVSMPYLTGSFSRAELNSAADLVREALTRGRLEAMKWGQAKIFRCEAKGRKFEIKSIDDLEQADTNVVTNNGADGGSENAKSKSTSTAGKDDNKFGDDESADAYSPSDMLRLSSDRLPDDVIFAAADVTGSAQISAMYGESNDENWSAPIIFNPDGTTSNASILLQNDREQTIRLTIRGLTGIVTVGEIGNEEVQ